MYSGVTAIGANPYSPKQGIWQRNGKTTKYAPMCQTQIVEKKFIIYPASTNNIINFVFILSLVSLAQAN